MIVESAKYNYTDPTFMGSGWFIRCSDDEGAQLVIKSRALTLKAALYKARRAVRGLSGCAVSREGYQTTSAFPPAFSGLVAAWTFTLVIDGLMPETSCYEARSASHG